MKKWIIVAEIVFVLAMAGVALVFQRMAAHDRMRAEQAVAEAKANAKALQAVEEYTERTVVIREKGNAATVKIMDAPTASSPVPADVLAAWSDGIEQLRKPPGSAADPGPVQGAVQGAK